jgi:t-SNARE complex subunit (syntaxin)
LHILIIFNGLAGFGLIVDAEEEAKEEMKAELPVPSDHKEFLQQIQFVQHSIGIIAHGIVELKQISSSLIMTAIASKEQLYSQQFKEAILRTNTTVGDTRKLIKSIQSETVKLESNPKINQTVIRLRKNMLCTVSHRFVQEIQVYQQFQTQAEAELKKKITRQLKLINSEITEDQINEALMKGESSEKFIKDEILRVSKVSFY